MADKDKTVTKNNNGDDITLSAIITSLTVPVKDSATKTEDNDFTLDLSDLKTANDTNRDTITTAITSTETTLKIHNTDIKDNIKADVKQRLGDTDTKGDIVSILTAFESNMESRLTDIDNRLNEMDKKYSKILGYEVTADLDTIYTESLAGIIGDVTSLKGTFDGKGTDELEDKTLTGVLQTLNDKLGDVSILKGTFEGKSTDELEDKSVTGVLQTLNDKLGDVSTLTNPVVVNNVTALKGKKLKDPTLTGIQQVLNDKIGDPEKLSLMVGEIVDAATEEIVSPGVKVTVPKSLSGLMKANFLSSQESWHVEKDLRKRFMNLLNPFMEAFNRMVDTLMQIAPVSPRL